MYVTGLGEREIVKHLMTFTLSLIIESDVQYESTENVQCRNVRV